MNLVHYCSLFTIPAKKKPLVFSDKRQSQHWSLQFIWLSRGSHKGSRFQTSTCSGLIKAYTNKPFRMLGGQHNRALEIKQAICIFHSVCIHLQHSLSFPDLWFRSFFSWAYNNISGAACHYTRSIKFRTVFTDADNKICQKRKSSRRQSQREPKWFILLFWS